MVPVEMDQIQPPTLLIVDDSGDLCSLLKEFFEDLGFQVKYAFNGQEALDHLKIYKPDCVLMDVQMPFMDGEGCIKRIKLRYPDLPVIVVTALGNVESVEKFARLGASGFIPKPIDLDILLTLVKRFLKESPNNR